MAVSTLKDLLEAGVEGRKILVRCDLNVPLDGTTITDTGRITASLPTLNALLDAGAARGHLPPHGTTVELPHALDRAWPRPTVADRARSRPRPL